MKTLEQLKQLRDELKEAYDTVLANPDTNYDQATVSYAKRCFEDADNAFKFGQFNEFIKDTDENLQISDK